MSTAYKTNINLANMDFALLIFRIGIGVLMFSHGFPKFLNFFTAEEIKFADPVGLGEQITFALAVFAEFVCAIFVILGFLTRFAAIPVILTMAVAVFIVHIEDPFSKQELPLLYLVCFTVIAMTGPGKYSLDYLLQNKK
ncbi:DoxX family protein [Pontixanthobacter gangjinensis]|uniref:DoxX family protein n=1 Tax=Christiangramia aestuarii TaxID=1028746 RepID=A0A7K1LPN7_9FLAO|nr:DoxX family protein [Christiangramia aestuarii]MUP42765.1 DoxX family protein [Christiangramia aestuarii]